jgi:hypothetical protein
MQDPDPLGDWSSYRKRLPPHRSDDAWNQSWGQDPYWNHRGAEPPSLSYDWRGALTRPRRPWSISAAVVLMCVSAGLSALETIYSAIRSDWAGYGATSLHGGAPGLQEAAAAVLSTGSVLFAVLGIALWLWMATAASAGTSLARTVATVYLVIGTLSMAVFWFELRSGWLASGETLLVIVLPAAAFWVLRLAIVVLLWTRESSAYFRSSEPAW